MPWRTRSQNARTRADSSAKPASAAIASTVSRNSAKRGCEAKNARSNAGSCEKSGGFGNAPWRERERSRIGIASERSKICSTKNDEPTAG